MRVCVYVCLMRVCVHVCVRCVCECLRGACGDVCGDVFEVCVCAEKEQEKWNRPRCGSGGVWSVWHGGVFCGGGEEVWNQC